MAGVTVATIRYWIGEGYLPDKPWTEEQIRVAATKTEGLGRTRGVKHGTQECWRAGCSRPECVAANRETVSQARARKREAQFPPAARTLVLDLLADGASITEAAAAGGVTRYVVRGRARWDPQWGDAVEDAVMTGRNPGITHGAESYRRGWCVCRDCRNAHAGRAGH